ncbi:protein kinase C and casein kinase substrate in neurons protein 1-like isoform X4 [Saccostrea echinata]|uniref:protein kinase C and casein kinase substrate in neurons protein 1-like isoform X4 n=1 Tax=Saccostrea echinata TaxID=191078 RepID=UPI002A809BBC|nr:protein kinase C and casein kinase substrate in neurons protein 1-like isoform X4 [Saccostrea echinata]
MSLNEDLVQPTNDSFWEIGKYHRTVKRIDNGKALCDSLRQLIKERSEIETSYAKNLTNWSKKWNEFLDKGNEYGTIQAGWRGLLQEADSLADLHNVVSENLMTKDYASIKLWQKENYHKSMMHFKETKELEEGFKKAQKPWEKKYTKVMQSRKDYHAACRAEKSTANQENNARGDSAVSPDQLKKIQEKLRKCQQDVEATRDKYEASLNDLNSYNAKYIEDMNEVFQKCQDFEKSRIEFFKKTMFEIHQHLDLSVEPKFSQVYSNLHSTIGQIDPDKDLRWWSTNHGADMPMNWPTFEEYSPELQNISKKKDSQLGGNDGITITSIRHKPDSFVQQSDSFNSHQRQTSTESPRSSTGSNVQQQQQQPQQSSTLRKISFDGFSLRKKEKDKASKRKTMLDQAKQPNVEEVKRNSDPSRVQQPPDSARLAQMDTDVSQADIVQKQQGGENYIRSTSYDESLNPFGDDDDADEANVTAESHVYQAIDEARGENNKEAEKKEEPAVVEDTNPFADDVDEPPSPSPEDSPRQVNGKEGVPVRALYDYNVTEEDELELKAGDVFVKLSEEDELGWCKGYKDGREGLYPANYVEPV